MTDNRKVATDFMQALGAGDVQKLKSLISEDIRAVCTGSCVLSGTRSYDEILGAAGMLKQATRDGITFRILTTTAEEDRVSLEAEGSATLPNGAAYDNQYHFLFFIHDGKISRIKEYMDTKLVQEIFLPLLSAPPEPGAATRAQSDLLP